MSRPLPRSYVATDAASRGLKAGADMPRTLIRKNPSNFKTLPLFVEATPEGLSYQSVGEAAEFLPDPATSSAGHGGRPPNDLPWNWPISGSQCA